MLTGFAVSPHRLLARHFLGQKRPANDCDRIHPRKAYRARIHDVIAAALANEA